MFVIITSVVAIGRWSWR